MGDEGYLFGGAIGCFLGLSIGLGAGSNDSEIPIKPEEILFENRNLEKDTVPDLVLKYKNETEEVFYAHPSWNYGIEYKLDKP